MTESYIQYLAGYQKDNVDLNDIKKAIADIQEMDDEHGAFWVSVITDDENVIEVNKGKKLSVIFQGVEFTYRANGWDEVEEFFTLLINEEFEVIKERIQMTA